MFTSARKTTPPDDEALETIPQPPLAEIAIDCLRSAAANDRRAPTVEERSVWQPDSWLIQRCWQVLAAASEASAALSVATMADSRNPLSSMQALHLLSQQAADQPALASLIDDELARQRGYLLAGQVAESPTRRCERLLLAAASATRVGAETLAFACLERLDQFPRGWERIYIQPDLRPILAQTLARLTLHPLTGYLIASSIRRYDDAGAQLLSQITLSLSADPDNGTISRAAARVMQRCIDAFRHATLASLHSRRAAAIALGRAGYVDDVLAQISTIASVQDARRESGLTFRGDIEYLREVKRPNANPDIDFQAYTLREAIHHMDTHSIQREQRVQLADRLAMLAVSSDGWTAAAATAPLIELGALKYAVDVVEHIPATDPTRSEGVISLVAGLLDLGEEQRAAEQVVSALAWAREFDGRNPERATIWGLAEVYLAHNQPKAALQLLDTRLRPEPFWSRARRLFRERVSDDQLHDDRLRLAARIMLGWQHDAEIAALLKRLCMWAPRLLDGDALIGFYVEGMLRPLLTSGRTTEAWELLPQILSALSASGGDKHSTRVTQVAKLLTSQIDPEAQPLLTQEDDDGATEPQGEMTETPEQSMENGEDWAQAFSQKEQQQSQELARRQARDFLERLWQGDVAKGLWQTTHSVEGSLPLLLALDGADALVTIARAVDREGAEWTQS